MESIPYILMFVFGMVIGYVIGKGNKNSGTS